MSTTGLAAGNFIMALGSSGPTTAVDLGFGFLFAGITAQFIFRLWRMYRQASSLSVADLSLLQEHPTAEPPCEQCSAVINCPECRQALAAEILKLANAPV